MLSPPLVREGAAGRRGAGEARAANAEEGVGAGAADVEAGMAGAGGETGAEAGVPGGGEGLMPEQRERREWGERS